MTVCSSAAVNVACDSIKKNGKTYLVVEAVNVSLDIEDFTIRLYSKLHNPLITDMINKAVHNQCRGFYKKIQSEIESYMGKIVQLIISLIVDRMAVEDFLQ